MGVPDCTDYDGCDKPTSDCARATCIRTLYGLPKPDCTIQNDFFKLSQSMEPDVQKQGNTIL